MEQLSDIASAILIILACGGIAVLLRRFAQWLHEIGLLPSPHTWEWRYDIDVNSLVRNSHTHDWEWLRTRREVYECRYCPKTRTFKVDL